MSTETAPIHGSTSDGSALPPDESRGFAPTTRLPPHGEVSAKPRHSPSSGPQPPASTEDRESDHVATAYPRQPRRYLDPELATAIKEAKLRTGASWRRVAKFTGLSHSFLVQLSNGQRVPSRQTVEVLAEWLPVEEWAVKALRDVAV